MHELIILQLLRAKGFIQKTFKLLVFIFLAMLTACQSSSQKKKPQTNKSAPICFTEELSDGSGISLICEGVPTVIKHGEAGKPGARGSNGSPGTGCTLENNTITCGGSSVTLPTAGGCKVVQRADGAEITCMDNTTASIKDGKTGQPGPSGAKGDRGEQGPIGATGNTGPKGDPGERGERGLQGVPGNDGRDGSSGRLITKTISCNGKIPADQYGPHDVTYQVLRFSDGYSEASFQMYINDFNFPGLFSNTAVVAPGSSQLDFMTVDLLGFNGYSATLSPNGSAVRVQHRKQGGYGVTINCKIN